MTEQVDDEARLRAWWERQVAVERERARRLRAATSALSVSALGALVGLSLPWAVSVDEHDPQFDPERALQLDEPGPWRADGWWLLRYALRTGGEDGGVWTVLVTAVPLVAAAVAAWALVRQDRTAAAAGRVVGVLGLVTLLVVGLRLVNRAGVEPGAGFWLAVGSCAVLVAGGVGIARALRRDAGVG